MPFRPLVLVFALLALDVPSVIHALDPYDLIESLMPKDTLPRVLNSDDIELQPNDPQPLFSPTGDFNNDGTQDMAIAGIYGLPSGNRYFLLIGTEFINPVRYEKLFFREYAHPVFLHKPGTTGERDPGDQAFSITPCSQCSDGLDYYWNKKKKTFEAREWLKRVRRYTQVPHIPEADLVPPETVDKALQIVGELPDVKVFVAGLKKAGKQLGTRVRPAEITGEAPSQVVVTIFEKKNKDDKIYDALTVDVEQGRVVKRRRGIKPSGGAVRDKSG